MRRVIAPLVIVVLLAGAAVIWTQSRHSTPPTTSTSTSTTIVPPIAPLTGLPDSSGASVTRPALTVKVENTPDALPQWGIDQADVVYEEIVNGGITRLAAIFNSQAPVKVGPVRSVRPTDTSIVWPLGGIFAYSGGAPYAVNDIARAPVKLVDESSAGQAMFRDPSRYAPHNLYANATALFALQSTLHATPTPPPALFRYSPAAWVKPRVKVNSFVVTFPSMYPVTWTWNATTGSWDRSIFGAACVTGTHVRVSPKDVVVMWVNYVNGVGAFTSYADLSGSGPVEVFADGRMVKGTWSRGPSKSDVLTYHDAQGATITMPPGQTWVELLNAGAPVPTK
jgi:hypothetical protein